MVNPKRSWRTRRSKCDARGDTLIEVLITLAIMSLAGVALITAFSTSISASSEYRGLSVTDTVLRTVSEQVIGQFQEGDMYQSCGTQPDMASYYTSMMQSTALVVPAPYASANYAATVSNVGFWNGAGYSASCTSGYSTAPQQITISLTGPFPVAQLVTFEVEGSGQVLVAGAVQLKPPTNVVPSTPTVTGDSGGLIVTFTDSSNAAAFQYYTVKACTNSSMNRGCTPVSNEFEPGDELQGLVPGTSYWVTVYANASAGFLASGSVEGGPATSSGTPSIPAVTSVASSPSTAGALVVMYTPENGAPNGETFTVMGCTDSAMSNNCVSDSPYSSGTQFTGLTQGTKYYVEVSGNSDGATSLPFTPAVMATVQLATPSSVSVTSSQIQRGALVVTFGNPPNAPSGQTYLVTGCTDPSMTVGCVSQSSYTSGNQFTGLTSGTKYYVNVAALASTGYLPSTSAPTATATQATTQFSQPIINGVGAPNGNAGKINVTFSGNGQTYTLIGCTDPAMTTGCTTNTNYASGAPQGTWPKNGTVYVTITANAAPGYLASIPSAQANGPAN